MRNYEHIEQLERIRVSYEQLLRQAEAMLDELEHKTDAYITLREYYISDQRNQDLLDDEQGLIPQTVKRGILSEDELYDLMGSYRETALRMIEVGTQMLRNY